jgi:hypothetical protein
MRTTLYDAITGFAIQLAQVPQEATTPAGPRLDSSLLHNAQMHSSGLMAGIETLDVVCATILDKGCNDSRVDFIQAECARVHTIRGMNRWVAAVLDFAKYGLEPQ